MTKKRRIVHKICTHPDLCEIHENEFKSVYVQKNKYIKCANISDKDYYTLDPKSEECEGIIKISDSSTSLRGNTQCDLCDRTVYYKDKQIFELIECFIIISEFFDEFVEKLTLEDFSIEHDSNLIYLKSEKKGQLALSFVEIPHFYGSTAREEVPVVEIALCNKNTNKQIISINEFLKSLTKNILNNTTKTYRDFLTDILNNLDDEGKYFENWCKDFVDKIFQNKAKIIRLMNQFPNKFQKYVRIGAAGNSDLILYDLRKILFNLMKNQPETIEAKGYRPKKKSKVTITHVAKAQEHARKLNKRYVLFVTTTMDISNSVYTAAISHWILDNYIRTYFIDGEALNTILWSIS